MNGLANENKRFTTSDEGFVVVNGKETVVEKNEMEPLVAVLRRCLDKLPTDEWQLRNDLRRAISDLETVGGL
jgi:hypothetical protein